MPLRLAALLLLLVAGPTLAQPTYRLDVRKELKARATLSLAGQRVKRSAVTDDPGFRLQFHIRRSGKTVEVINARADDSADLPVKDPGDYTVVLELFHPGYKGGTALKGEFKPISEVLTYRVEGGKVTLVPPKASPVPSGPGVRRDQ